MGLTKRERGVYLNVSAGKLRQKSDSNDPEAEKRSGINPSTNEPFEVWERVYDSITGYIKTIDLRKTDFGTQYVVRIVDGLEHYNINISYDTKYARSLIERLMNVDFTKEVQLTPYSFKKGKNNFTGISVSQDGEKVQSFFREYDAEGNMKGFINGYPHLEFTEEGYDDDDYKAISIQQNKFLKRVMLEKIMPKLEGIEEKVEDFEDEEPPPPSIEDAPEVEPDDDLPF